MEFDGVNCNLHSENFPGHKNPTSAATTSTTTTPSTTPTTTTPSTTTPTTTPSTTSNQRFFSKPQKIFFILPLKDQHTI